MKLEIKHFYYIILHLIKIYFIFFFFLYYKVLLKYIYIINKNSCNSINLGHLV